jgi:hypothetical protein
MQALQSVAINGVNNSVADTNIIHKDILITKPIQKRARLYCAQYLLNNWL